MCIFTIIISTDNFALLYGSQTWILPKIPFTILQSRQIIVYLSSSIKICLVSNEPKHISQRFELNRSELTPIVPVPTFICFLPFPPCSSCRACNWVGSAVKILLMTTDYWSCPPDPSSQPAMHPPIRTPHSNWPTAVQADPKSKQQRQRQRQGQGRRRRRRQHWQPMEDVTNL